MTHKSIYGKSDYVKLGLLLISLIATCAYSSSLKAEAIQLSESKINVGTIQVGEEQLRTIIMKNRGDKPYPVMKIGCGCSCLKAIIDKPKILPGETAKIQMRISRRIVGEFELPITILPEKESMQEAIVIPVFGEVASPFIIKAGWSNRKHFVSESAGGWYRLGMVHKSSLNLEIQLTPKSKTYSFEDTTPTVHSDLFQLKSTSLEDALSKDSKDQILPSKKLVIKLIPNVILQLQRQMKLSIICEFKEGPIITIPLLFRVVDNIYIDNPEIQLDNFNQTNGDINKTINVYFYKNTKPWNQIKWRVSGTIAKAVQIHVDKNKISGNKRTLNITVKASEMSNIPEGIVFGRIKLFEREDDECIPIIVIVGNYEKISNNEKIYLPTTNTIEMK